MITVDLLKTIKFFSLFTDEQLAEILPLSERRLIKAGETVLEQGSINLDLYFLLQGEVDIFLDQVHIVTSSQAGQIFGEMSIANHTTCTATVKTKTDCHFLVLNFPELKNAFESQGRDSLLKCFYQSCAEILAKKLIMTTELARTYKGDL